MGSAPERSCAVCRRKAPQSELERWIVLEGQAVQDRQQGRGYYSCPNCIDKAKLVIESRSQAKNNKRRA